MAWIILLIAGFLEVVWTVGLKYSHGFTRLWPSVVTAVAMAVSVFLLSQAMKMLPMGTAYAVWTGIGAVGGVVMGIILFNEPATASRLICLGLIVTGIIGLQIFEKAV